MGMGMRMRMGTAGDHVRMPPRRVVAVIGPGSDASEEHRALAYWIGTLLASRDIVVVNGGLDGVMEAAARGVREAGGIVIGLLPGDDRADANPELTVAIPTGLGQARNALVVACADAVVAVGGSWGTISEIALARRAGKPVVCLRGWQLADAGGVPIPLEVASSPEEAVEFVAAHLTDGQAQP
jgi:uncharacterized protein (TIGR00725 family)